MTIGQETCAHPQCDSMVTVDSAYVKLSAESQPVTEDQLVETFAMHPECWRRFARVLSDTGGGPE